MNKKERIYDFLNGLQATMNDAWIEFSSKSENKDIAKPSFSSYRSNAIKDGVFNPIKKSVISTQPKGTSKPSNLNNKIAEYETIDINNIDKSNFITLETGTVFDKIASKRNALMSSTTYIITGESGAGKTTVATNIADYIMEADPTKTAGFISCEMDKMDWTEECIDNPRLANIPTIFMLEYLDADNYVEILSDSLHKFDYVILDSFEVVIDQIKELKNWTAKRAEVELIKIMRLAASESGTCIMAIQQYTKGGTFVGSNKIKHMLTGMIFVKIDSNGDHFLYFDKNRRGGNQTNINVYFTKCKDTGRILFDEKRYETLIKVRNFKKDEQKSLEEEEETFDNEILKMAKLKQEKRLEALNAI